MKVLITGATGFVGQKLVAYLLRKDYQIVVVSRNSAKAKKLFFGHVEYIEWDQLAKSKGIKDVEAIIHLAGASIAQKRWSDKRKQEIIDSRINLLAQLEQAFKKQKASKLKTIVSASAVGFYGNRGGEELDESCKQGLGFLAQVCQAWERALQSTGSALGVRTVALRFGIVLGRNGGVLGKLVPLFRIGFGAKLGNGKQWMSWIHIDDLLQTIGFAVENKNISNAVNVVAPECVTNKAFTKQLSKHVGFGWMLFVPKFFLKLVLGEMSTMLLYSQKVTPKKLQVLGFTFQYSSLSQTFKDLLGGSERYLFAYEKTSYYTADQESLFNFHGTEEHLNAITPPWLKFQILEKTTDNIEKDTRITYKLSVHGIPMKWTTHIVAWDPYSGFVDRQEKGPFAFFHHTHTFVKLKKGSMKQELVYYKAPGGWIGCFFLGWYLQYDMRRIFKERDRNTRKLLNKEKY